MPRGFRFGVEDAGVLVLAALATLYLQWNILFVHFVFQADALTHTYWMRRFQDGGLFHDPLTQALVRSGYVPLGVQGIYYAASWLIDPVRLGAWGAIVLAPLSAWLLFRIVREHTSWRSAAWLGAALFLLPWNIQQFDGMHARAFGQPIVLLTLYLLLRGRRWWAAIVPPVAGLLYPPAALVGLGQVVAVPLRQVLATRRLGSSAVAASVSAAATALALLAPRIAGIQDSRLISASLAHHYPEFSDRGQMNFFSDSVVAMLRGQYSGFDLDTSGSVLLVAAVLVIAVCPSNARRVRPEVWSMAAASIFLFAASYVVLFRLYLPNRYVRPLVPVFCIVIAVGWEPAWHVASRWLRWPPILVLTSMAVPAALVWVAARELPLGPQITGARFGDRVRGDAVLYGWSVAAGVVAAIALALGRRRSSPSPTAIAAVLSGVLLIGAVAIAGNGQAQGFACPDVPVLRYVATLPTQAIIAGDPIAMDCVPIVTRRPVLMSRKLYQVYDLNVLRFARPRMFAEIRAYYGGSRRAIAALATRYGADYLIVDRQSLASHHEPRPYGRMAPFGGLVARLLGTVRHPAALSLPRRCLTWRRGGELVYSLRCVSSTVSPGPP